MARPRARAAHPLGWGTATQKRVKTERAFFYHSGGAKEIVGIAKIVRASFPDPADPRWLAVEIAPAKALRRPVALAELRTAGTAFADMPLLTRPRLSVQPVETRYWNAVLAQAEKPAP